MPIHMSDSLFRMTSARSKWAPAGDMKRGIVISNDSTLPADTRFPARYQTGDSRAGFSRTGFPTQNSGSGARSETFSSDSVSAETVKAPVSDAAKPPCLGPEANCWLGSAFQLGTAAVGRWGRMTRQARTRKCRESKGPEEIGSVISERVLSCDWRRRGGHTTPRRLGVRPHRPRLAAQGQPFLRCLRNKVWTEI